MEKFRALVVISDEDIEANGEREKERRGVRLKRERRNDIAGGMERVELS